MQGVKLSIARRICHIRPGGAAIGTPVPVAVCPPPVAVASSDVEVAVDARVVWVQVLGEGAAALPVAMVDGTVTEVGKKGSQDDDMWNDPFWRSRSSSRKDGGSGVTAPTCNACRCSCILI